MAQFRASAHPFVYTPGDNDWTDCHEPVVKGGDPLERLASLRTVFFQTPSLEHFTRVETFGTPYHHWLHVTVDASDPNVFTFRPRIVAANLTQRP